MRITDLVSAQTPSTTPSKAQPGPLRPLEARSDGPVRCLVAFARIKTFAWFSGALQSGTDI